MYWASAGSTNAARESAIRTFSTRPMAKKEIPRASHFRRSAVPRDSRSCSICRKRTIGPATSCEKSDTYAENSKKLPRRLDRAAVAVDDVA